MRMIQKFIISLLVVFVFLVHGVSNGTDEVSLMEGDSVTLYSNVKINQGVGIKWYYYDDFIARISGDPNKTCTDVQCNEGTERFKDRLKLDNQTGSLTITNTTTEHTGVYHLKIRSSSTGKIFKVTVHDVSAEQDQTKRKTVKEGDPVTLETPVEKHSNSVMTWYFNDILIVSGDQSQICTDVQCKERFSDRLKLDQFGSLTITNTRTEDSGEYTLQINISTSSFSITRTRSFSVTVTADPGSGLSPGAITGICVGVGLVVLLAVACWKYYRHRNPRCDMEKNRQYAVLEKETCQGPQDQAE
ncbi:carcinoembryonic antigen-related cell adhesion molecule 1-like [Pimephales promelas]|uniref:carcinoembryonic antigen-related cell adhesion molecule 1-like n=1 Tax=Pimephales promelas TaxID=90988 RepID=UPI001955EECB|nr:carcinoembryonic antigen-related cell adhesion molecule 1-like [Pimephales promelas]